MKLIRRTYLLFATLLSLALCAPVARADAEPKVSDAAHFFKPETVQKVDAEVKLLKVETNVEVVVETFEGVPDDRKSDWDAAKDDETAKHDFYQSWMEARGHDLKLNGIYVLVVRNPGHVEVLAGKKTHEKAFPKSDQDRMSSLLLGDFKAKQFDDGLQKAVDFARDTVKRNLNGQKHATVAGYDPFPRNTTGGMRPQTGPPVNSGVVNPPVQAAKSHWSCMTILLVIVGVIVLLSVIGRLSGNRNSGGSGGYSNNPGYGPGQVGGGGYGSPPARGGGFMSGIFGGLLGGAAGSYIENRMENHHGNQNTGGTPPTDTGYAPPQQQNDYGSSGGDFGSSSSSSDNSSSSGGDFGSSGGDSGGGGGGGDSGGSSGGDF